MAYDVGDKIRLKATFTNVDGVPTNPSSMFFRYEHPGPPSAVVTKTWNVDGEVVNDGPGVFHLDLSIDEKGTWRYYTKGTGTVQAASPVKTFQVNDQGF